MLDYGFETAVLRAVTAVPAHTFFAVIMGYYYSMYHTYGKARIKETELKRLSLIPPKGAQLPEKRFLLLSLLMPVLAHGLYDYSCTVGSSLAEGIFYGFLIFLYIYCFAKIRKMSKYDTSDNTYANRILAAKYPQFSHFFGEESYEQQL